MACFPVQEGACWLLSVAKTDRIYIYASMPTCNGRLFVCTLDHVAKDQGVKSMGHVGYNHNHNNKNTENLVTIEAALLALQ